MKKNNEATSFLEVEIMKQVFSNAINKDVLIQTVFNLDCLELDKKSQLTRKALLYIESNLFEHVTLDKISKHCFSSKSSLLRYFKADMKQSPLFYIKNRRLDEAFRILKSGNKTVSETAFKVGYSDLSAFTSAFKRKFGVTASKIFRP